MQRTHLQDSPAFHALQSHHQAIASQQMRALFADDPERFSRMSLDAAGLFLDYSKNRIDDQTIALLCALARARGVEAQRERMFAGEKINTSEQRAVLHVALRAPAAAHDGDSAGDTGAQVHAVLARMRDFSDQVRSGRWRGAGGKPLTAIVNIGIGGSFLGPKMACHALRGQCHPGLDFHFISNVDSSELNALLPRLDPECTLFIIASKTFGTAETMMNAQSARAWLVDHCGEAAIARHFVAVSTNREAVTGFGIDAANMFGFWDWVGGRYSVWSAVGLPVMLAIGADGFAQFLAGAHAMDTHFRTAPLEANMPVLLALIGIWYRNLFDCSTLSIAPYWQDLQYLPGYLQQLDMESNGKHVAIDGTTLQLATAPVIWGDVGTNGQHAYFQLLHQGTELVPVDFITVLQEPKQLSAHHKALLANCFAQSAALMRGKTPAEVAEELYAQDMSADRIAALAPHRTFDGNRPSNTILLPRMTPQALGALIALYEHKVFVQGVVWGINSFDQWGVELGKALTKDVEAALNASASTTGAAQDSSTAGLIARARASAACPDVPDLP
ncbi:MAG: glucose-6-phosphate isomerase [Herminiimonas sp.]|nr:glucose-6-phosphate isomerase [Herminiimonas sp.]